MSNRGEGKTSLQVIERGLLDRAYLITKQDVESN